MQASFQALFSLDSRRTSCEDGASTSTSSERVRDADSAATSSLSKREVNGLISHRITDVLSAHHARRCSDPMCTGQQSWHPSHQESIKNEHDLKMPEFLPEWRADFEGSIVHPRLYPFRAMMFSYGFFTFVGLVGQLRKEDGSRGGQKWAMIQWGGYVAVVLASVVVSIICSLPQLRPLAIRRRDLLAGIWLAIGVLGHYTASGMTELRRGAFQARVNETDPIVYMDQLSYSMTTSNFMPLTLCEDADVVATLSTWKTGSSSLVPRS